MTIYDFDDYKQYFNAWVLNQPKNGHGEFRRAANAMNVSTTMISQVFKGEKHLSLEMAAELSEYLRLTEEETEYFLLLVEMNRAGSFKLQKKLEKQVKGRQERARKVENRVKTQHVMSEETKSVFYSNWLYVAIHLMTAIEGQRDVVHISQRLNLPRNQTQKVIDFLLENHLCVMEKGELIASNVSTHIGSSHLLVGKHHQNWRLQGMQKMQNFLDSDLFFTMPCALSTEDAEKIRNLLLEAVVQIKKIVRPSESQVLRCLNIDWFEI